MGKLDSSLGLTDTMPFGKKHKGKTIEDIYKVDAGYLLWLRDKRKEDQGDAVFFNPEVLTLLDETLLKDKNLASKHKSWGNTMLPQGPVTAPAAAVEASTEFAYAGSWGAF
jgi:hypothetical protein